MDGIAAVGGECRVARYGQCAARPHGKDMAVIARGKVGHTACTLYGEISRHIDAGAGGRAVIGEGISRKVKCDLGSCGNSEAGIVGHIIRQGIRDRRSVGGGGGKRLL